MATWHDDWVSPFWWSCHWAALEVIGSAPNNVALTMAATRLSDAAWACRGHAPKDSRGMPNVWLDPTLGKIVYALDHAQRMIQTVLEQRAGRSTRQATWPKQQVTSEVYAALERAKRERPNGLADMLDRLDHLAREGVVRLTLERGWGDDPIGSCNFMFSCDWIHGGLIWHEHSGEWGLHT